MQVIAIAGASGSGKTTLAQELAQKLAGTNPLVIPLDAYYRDFSALTEEARALLNFDHPDALESELIFAHLTLLLSGEEVQIPSYDFKVHARSGYTKPVRAHGIIILEGIYALYWQEIRALCSHRIFVDTPQETCFSRRFKRDQCERGRNPDSIASQWQTTVAPMFQSFALPTREFATQWVSGELAFCAPAEALASQILQHER